MSTETTRASGPGCGAHTAARPSTSNPALTSSQTAGRARPEPDRHAAGRRYAPIWTLELANVPLLTALAFFLPEATPQVGPPVKLSDSELAEKLDRLANGPPSSVASEVPPASGRGMTTGAFGGAASAPPH